MHFTKNIIKIIIYVWRFSRGGGVDKIINYHTFRARLECIWLIDEFKCKYFAIYERSVDEIKFHKIQKRAIIKIIIDIIIGVSQLAECKLCTAVATAIIIGNRG
jgi:hypothetical protein